MMYIILYLVIAVKIKNIYLDNNYMTLIKINFTVPVTLYIEAKHISAICKYIKYNAILNSDNNIISDFGIIDLLETNIEYNDNILFFTIVVNVADVFDIESLDNINNIIRAILPAAYSKGDLFYFYIDSLIIVEKYILDFLENPSNITIQKN